jgi:hypothetical protein
VSLRTASRSPRRGILSRVPGACRRLPRRQREGAHVAVEEAPSGSSGRLFTDLSKTRCGPSRSRPAARRWRVCAPSEPGRRQERTPPRSGARRTGRGRLRRPRCRGRVGGRSRDARGATRPRPRGRLDTRQHRRGRSPSGRIGGSLTVVSGPCLTPAKEWAGFADDCDGRLGPCRGIGRGLQLGYLEASRGSGNVPGSRSGLGTPYRSPLAAPARRPHRADARPAGRRSALPSHIRRMPRCLRAVVGRAPSGRGRASNGAKRLVSGMFDH